MVTELMFGIATITLTSLLWERKINVEELDFSAFLKSRDQKHKYSGATVYEGDDE